MNNNIYLICGESDLLPELEKIKSNPNYVFQADPTYTPINLFNEFGDVITVNSWVECANYVNGGWINNIVEFINYERYLVWLLVQKYPYWYWSGKNNQSMWYDSIKIYRQSKLNSWSAVFNKIENDLKSELADL